MIGLSGADAERHTIGELRRMAEAKDAQEWGRTSCLLAMMINVNSGKKVKPWQLNPYTAPRKGQRTIKDLTTMLKDGPKHKKVVGHAPPR